MTTNMSLEKVIEALLFSAQKPLSIHEITAAIKAAEGDQASETPNEFARVKNAEVAAALEQLKGGIHSAEPRVSTGRKSRRLATGYRSWLCKMGPAAFPGAEAGAFECACAGNVGNHCVSPADYACGRRSGARREHRWRAANVDGARFGENRRTRRNPGATAPLRNDTIFPRSLRSAQSRRIAKRGRVAETLFAGGATCNASGDGRFGVAHASRVLVSASRRNDLYSSKTM